jgi:hypothetical protein
MMNGVMDRLSIVSGEICLGMKVFGEFEDCAFRSFPEKERAEQFVAGEITFRSIYHYRTIEDEKRRDRKEGNAHVVVNARSKFAMFATNSIYIVSCHRTLQSAKQSLFGRFIVEIRNPRRLAEEITKQLHQLPIKSFGGVEGVIVEYTKGGAWKREPTSVDMARLAYAQKPPEFSKENEFRFVLICNASAHDSLTVRMGRKLDYCRMHSHV